jgi:hypothetical protein
MSPLLVGTVLGILALGASWVRGRTRSSRARARFVAICGGEGDGEPRERDSLLLDYGCSASFPPPSESTALVVLSDGAARVVQRCGETVKVRFGWIAPRRLRRRLARFEGMASQNLGLHVRDGRRWSVTTPEFRVSGVCGMPEPEPVARVRGLGESYASWVLWL